MPVTVKLTAFELICGVVLDHVDDIAHSLVSERIAALTGTEQGFHCLLCLFDIFCRARDLDPRAAVDNDDFKLLFNAPNIGIKAAEYRCNRIGIGECTYFFCHACESVFRMENNAPFRISLVHDKGIIILFLLYHTEMKNGIVLG